MSETEDESFAEMFEESLRREPKRVEPGQRVTGTVVTVGSQRVLLDLGGGLDGMMELSELVEPGELPTVQPGDKLEGWVVRVESRTAELVRKLGHGAAARKAIEDSRDTGVPIEGTVTAVNKGGFVVEIAGTRCFCPMGQMDIHRIEDPATFIGKKLTFRVVELRGDRDVVVSRRALLEEEQARRAVETRQKLAVGARFTGIVTGVREFGAFLDIGGLDGLLPASEFATSKQRPADVLAVGDALEVEVTRIEPGKDGRERISLSMRAQGEAAGGEPRPPAQPGAVLDVTVDRVEPFGAFVTWDGGRGLVPSEEMGLPRGADARRTVKPGMAMRVAIVDVRDDGKIRLSRVAAEQAEERAEAAAFMAAEPRPAGKGFGTFGDLLKKK